MFASTCTLGLTMYQAQPQIWRTLRKCLGFGRYAVPCGLCGAYLAITTTQCRFHFGTFSEETQRYLCCNATKTSGCCIKRNHILINYDKLQPYERDFARIRDLEISRKHCPTGLAFDYSGVDVQRRLKKLLQNNGSFSPHN